MTSHHSEPLPDWWVENKRIKEELDLPDYRPPRFLDDVYVHERVSTLEDMYDVTIRFRGIDTRYPDDWTVFADDTPLFEVGRRRDVNGNTVYQLSVKQFEERFVEEMDTIEDE
ncbi:hypothetical protein ACFQPA_20340 [Halomarina halobia]|uniref:Uncharacterized protein n=1 Tax=Halomarina halobia TaxID=3033386 RepID=A0ABD6AF64_9EURY|nr:hypothetical protein [Halomarina sp. PSR21]